VDREKPIFDELSKDRKEYIMKNPDNGLEIKCTEKFVKQWEKRGFTIVGKGKLRLIKPEESI
jgi:hypothetical protein